MARTPKFDAQEATQLAGDDNTGGDVLHHIAEQHTGDKNIMKKVVSNPKAQGKTLDLAFNAGYEDALDHENVPGKTVDNAINQISTLPANKITYDHIDRVMHEKANPKKRDALVAKLMDTPSEDAGMWGKSIVSNYYSKGHASEDMMHKGLNHPDHDILSGAIKSPKISDENVDTILARKDVGRDLLQKLTENESLSSDSLRKIHAAAKKMKKDSNEYYHNSVDKDIAEHQNTPPDVLDKYSNKKSSYRREAMSNPNYPLDKLIELHHGEDSDAQRALIRRKDTPEETLREIDKQYPTIEKYNSEAKALLKHPNYPEDLMLKRAKGSTEGARALLSRTAFDMPQSVLKALVNHKNTNVALDALKHSEVTPDVVLEAYNRKAHDVAAAAGAHPLLPKEMQAARAVENKDTAASLSRSSNDPALLNAIAQQWGSDPDVQRNLLGNQHVDPETLHNTVMNAADSNDEDQRSYNNPLRSLKSNANLSEKTRKFLLYHPNHEHLGFNSDKLTVPEAREALEHWSREARDQSGQRAGELLSHPNMDKEMIKDILTGKYGVPSHNSDLGAYVKQNPDLYSKDVLETALNTPAELTNSKTVGTIAGNSDFLTSDDVHNQISKALSNRSGAGDDQRKHNQHVAEEMLKNPNVDPKLLTDFVSQSLHKPINEDHSALLTSALENESYPKDHLKEIYTHRKFADEDSQLPGILGHYMKEHVDPEEKNEALRTTNNPQFASRLLTGRYSDLADASTMQAALQNPNPEVSSKVLDFLKDPHHKAMKSGRYAELINSLTDHPHEEVRSKAFPLMSPESQAKMMAGQDVLSRPDLIPGLKTSALEHQTIQPHHTLETISKVLNHPGLRWEHVSQMVDHSPEAATSAVKILHNIKHDDEGKIRRDDVEHLGHVHEQIMNKYPENNELMGLIASTTPDSHVLDKFVDDPKLMGQHSNSIINNPKVKSEQLDKFLKLKGPSHDDLFANMVDSPKASTKMLEHIAANYPELMQNVASHPKAYSPKVVKSIISSGDERAIAAVLNNPKTSDEVRDTFKNSPNVLLSLNRDYVEPKDLMKLADTDDFETQLKIIRHPSVNGEVLDKLAHSTVEKVQDPQAKLQRLHMISDNPDHELSAHTQQLMLQHGDASTFSNVLSNDHNNVSHKDIAEALDKFTNDPNYREMVSSSVHNIKRDNEQKPSPELINKIIDHIPNLGEEYPTHSGARQVIGSDLIENLIDSPARESITPETYDKILNKLENDRGAGYKNDHVGRINLVSDRQLLSSMASYGPSSLLSKLAEYPELHKLIADERGNDVTPEIHAKMINGVGHLLNLNKSNSFGQTGSHLVRLMNNKLTSENDFDNLFHAGINHLDSNEVRGFVHAVSTLPNLPDHILNKMVEERQPVSILSNPKITKLHLKSLMHQQLSAEEMVQVAKNPNASFRDFNEMMEAGGHSPSIFADAYLSMLSRPQSPEDLQDAYELLPQNSKLAQKIAMNPGVSEETLKEMHSKGQISTDTLESTPHLGGKIWRAKRHEIPARIPGISPSDTPETNAQVIRPRVEKIHTVANMIPEGGHIEWANFKKDNASLAGDPLIQRMFTTAPKQRLTKEHAEQYLANMPGKEFNMSYQKWTGMQRHNPVPQLVVNVNNGPFMDEYMAKDPKAATMYNLIQQAAKNSGHPITPQSIGWARVDTSDKDHWFVDEIQSDFNSAISQQLSQIQDNSEHAQRFAQKYNMTVEEAKKALYKVTDIMQGWEKALLEHVMDLAKKKGIKKVSIHSGESKTRVNKGKDAEVTNKYDKLYNKLPQDLGFKSSWYKNMPTAKDENLNSHKVWTHEIPTQTKKSELTEESLANIRGLIESIKKADMSSYGPDAFKAVMETLQSLIKVLSAHTTSVGSEPPSKEEPEEGKEDKKEGGKASQSGKDKPITHHRHEVYAPGAVRTDPDGQTREKMASGEWTHVSRQGDH